MHCDRPEFWLATLLATAVALPAQTSKPVPKVSLGIDVLERGDFACLQNQRVGLITNHTGRTGNGRSTVDVLWRSKQVRLVALFAPEHGFLGEQHIGKVKDATHADSGLVVHSLYGETRKPTRQMLAGIDTLVFDIQDIGCRFYTYISTMGLAMEAAVKHGKRFVVLDRPNPLGGIQVGGPLPDKGREDFVSFHRIGISHDMTIGELATMFRRDRKALRTLDLHVVKMQGWQRSMSWEDTGLEWINPSPNIRSPMQAQVYPGVGLWEFTNLSVGRGTDTPFRRLGAPWLQHREMATLLNKIPGLACVPVRFTPSASVYKDKECRGVLLTVTDRREFSPWTLGLALAVHLRRLHPKQWDTTRLDRLLKHDKLATWILKGAPEQSPIQLMGMRTVDLYK